MIIIKTFLLFALTLWLAGCEMGEDTNGPYKSYLLLKASNAQIVRFHLGGHQKLNQCVSQVKYEVDHAYAGKYFWTNSDYTYGGKEQDNWIKHEVVGVICETEERNEGWKILKIEESSGD